jgi:hypothetical protein
MIRRSLLLFSCLLALSGGALVQADEGMWQPHQLPALGEKLSEMGLEIDPSRLTDLTGHPMNAVISLGGCTASFVSPEGLVVTNHHCAYGSIQYNSTEENNLIESGFLARTREEELFAGPGSRVLVTVEVTDVTEQVLGGVPEEMAGIERYEAIETTRKKLVAACEKDEGHRCSVRSFHGGLEYYLIKALEIRDVRLVYAPARGIGNYGGDVDNWFWPRHTGDYSFYRAYVGPDGKPADFSEKNVPFRPPHHLKVATDDLGKGDFVMVAGYPGRTNRYRLASEVEDRFHWYYPSRKQLLEDVLAVIQSETAERPGAAIKYAGFVAGINNATKNYQGMLNGFARGDMLERKRKEEAELREWAKADGADRAGYLAAMDGLEKLVAESRSDRECEMYRGLMGRGAMLSSARTLYRLSKEKQKPDADREAGFQERDLRRIRERLERVDRRFDPVVEREILRLILLRYAAIPVEQHIAELDAWFGIAGNEVDEAALGRKLEEMFAKTKLGDLETRLAWLEAGPEAFEKSDDPFIRFAVALYPADMEVESRDKEITGRFSQLRPRYMQALIALKESRGEPLYADANGTLRVTYGTVQGYSPRDGVYYTPFTTVNGILEKNTGEPPFDAPEAELKAIAERRFCGHLVPELDSVPVDFLSNVDTTGGNSGSPSLNGKGELVGLLFDGVWESIISDWDFLPAKTRSIHADMRYVLWIMDKVDHADHLLREMGINSAEGAKEQ